MDILNKDEFLVFLNQKIGARAILVNEAGLYKGIYPTRVEDVKGDQVGLSHPLLRGALLPVLRNVELKLRVDAEDSLYQTVVSVVRGAPREDVPMLWVTPVTEARRVQRRNFVRVPCLLKTAFFRLEGVNLKPEREEWVLAVSNDISLGGVRVIMSRAASLKFKDKDRALIRLEVQGETLFLTGNAVRREQKGEGWELGFAFEAVPAFMEKTLGAFIRQQELAGRQ